MRKIYIGLISLLTIFILYSCKVKSDNNIDTIEQTVSQSQDYIVETTTGSSFNTCSEAEIEQIKLLAKMLYYAAGSSNHIGEGKILSTGEEQFRFLIAINEIDYNESAESTLKDYMHMKEDSMKIDKANAVNILKMAGAKEDMGVWEYILDYKERYEVEGDSFIFSDQNRWGGESYKEYKDWQITFNDDVLQVKCRINDEPVYGDIYDMEVRFHKNDKSAFGEYTADYMMLSPVEPVEGDESFLADFEKNEYKTPMNFGSSFDEYRFSLEGAMYKMPIPLDEVIKNGWVANEKLPDNKDRKEIILEKEGKKIFCILWKHKNKDWYVVDLKTQVGRELANVDFELFNDIKKGEQLIRGKYYDDHDVLYYYYYGTNTFFDENNIVQGFEIRYAPKYIDRDKRILDLCEDMTKEVVEAIKGDTELKTGVTYKLSDGEKEINIQLRRLSKVDWSKSGTAIFIVEKDKTVILPLIEYNAGFTLCVGNADDIYIKVEGYDTAVHPEAEIIYLKEYFQ